VKRDDFQINNEAGALRRRADALLVLVITPDHVFYSADPKMPPGEIERVLTEEASTVANHVRSERVKGGKR
jgi:hypothetical protein